MESDYQHKVLVVDDDEQIRKALDRILRAENFDPTLANSGEEALQILSKAKTTFSLIISDQRMGEMKGTQFLKKAKQVTPNTIRFLMTGHSNMETIINAVNKGAIQRYIAKPWDNDMLVHAIKSGITLFEEYLENRKLIGLAKKQNTKLYDLNCELMELTKSHTKDIQALDHQIISIKKEIESLSPSQANTPGALSKEIISWINNQPYEQPSEQADEQTNKQPEESTKNTKDQQNRLAKLYSESILNLYEQFKETAYKSGFEMPAVKGEL